MDQKLLVFQPRSLLYLSQHYLYYMIYNITLLFENNAYWYFYCDPIPGCIFESGYRNTCTVPMVEKYYSIFDLKKKDPLKLCQYAEMLFEDLREIMEFDLIISELWMQEYEFKFRHWKEPREFLVLRLY